MATVRSRRILIVEDEIAIRDLVRHSLVGEPFTLVEASDGHSAFLLMAEQMPDLILLDWMLPGRSGIELAKKLRQQTATQDIPIVFLTAKAEEDNKIKGLETGADDYITKPFSPRELVARIKAVLRRGLLETPAGLISLGCLEIDAADQRVYLSGAPLKVGPIEYRLLYFLISHQNRVYSREQLLNAVWGGNVDVDERTVDVHIRRLRKLLQPAGLDQSIQTVRGAGYRFSNREDA